jgi:Flp pilus assembly protein TadD
MFFLLLLLVMTFSAGASVRTALMMLESPTTDDSASTLQTARKLISQAKYADAEAVLRKALSTDEASADARFLLAYSLFRQNKPKESLNEYTRAAHFRKPSAEDLRFVGLDYVLLNDYVDADKWVSQSLLWNDKNFETWYSLGRIRYTENRFQDALNCFSKALELAPKTVKAENNLGLAYEGLNRTDDAVVAYRRAIDWQENAEHPSEQPLLNLGRVLVDRGQFEEALALLTRAVAISPRDPEIRKQLGRAYLRQGRLHDAQMELEQAVGLSPESAPLHFLLGQVYHREGIEEKARSEFARASALNGTHSTPDRK